MNKIKGMYRWLVFTILSTLVFSVHAVDYMKVTKSQYTIKNFKFESGETLSNLKITYRTFGNPKG